MSPTLSALLRASKSSPEDEPRLVLADWLEEHGDPDRAELIRLQLALAKNWGDEPDAPEQEVRVAWLTRRNAERWFGPARRFYHAVRLERGFLYVWATARELLDHPPTELPEDVFAWLEELYVG